MNNACVGDEIMSNGDVPGRLLLCIRKADEGPDASDCKTLGNALLSLHLPFLPTSLRTAIDTFRPDLYSSPLGDSTSLVATGAAVRQHGLPPKWQPRRHRRGCRHAPAWHGEDTPASAGRLGIIIDALRRRRAGPDAHSQ